MASHFLSTNPLYCHPKPAQILHYCCIIFFGHDILFMESVVFGFLISSAPCVSPVTYNILRTLFLTHSELFNSFPISSIIFDKL